MSSGNFGNRVWYHGTSKAAYRKMVKAGFMKAQLADDYDFGEAVWFTSDLEEAKQFGDVVLCIFNTDVARFKNKKLSSWPHGSLKKFGMSKNHDGYNLVVQENIPLKFVKLHK